MTKAWCIIALVVLALSGASSAFALSSETRGDQNSDGTSKFADPDDQKPAFMLNGNGGEGYATTPSSGFANVTIPSTGDTTPGARAFDEAVSRQQNR